MTTISTAPTQRPTALDAHLLSAKAVWFYAMLSPICMGLAFSYSDFFWPLAFVAPFGWLVLASNSVLSRKGWIAVTLCAWVMWMWLQLWMVDVTALGYPISCVYLALYAPLGIWVFHRARRGFVGRHLPCAVIAPIVVCAIEWLKDAVIFDGYPWYSVGQPVIESRIISQFADIFGAVFATFLVVCVAGAAIDLRAWIYGARTPELRRRAILGSSIALLVLTCTVAYGAWRVQETPSVLMEGPRILAVQTNLTTDNKLGWPRERQESDVLDFGRLTISLVDAQQEQGERIDLVVWPETMLPGFGLEPKTIQTLVSGGFFPGDQFSSFAAMLAKRVDAPMLIGSPAFLGLRAENQIWEWDQQFNSAYLVDGDAPYQRYDKVFLTPFGETMPYISKWTWLEEQLLALGARGMTFDLDASMEFRRISFEWGAKNETRKVMQCATPICFEDTVPGVVRKLIYADGQKKSALIVNLSNDGWFGFSDWARRQHELIARWRCIENRTPMVRVANTGISRAFTSEGVAISGAMVPARTLGGFAVTVQLDQRETIFGRWGDVLSPSMAFLAFIFVAQSFRIRSSASGMTKVLPLFVFGLLLYAAIVGCASNSNSNSSGVAAGPSWSSRPGQNDSNALQVDQSASQPNQTSSAMDHSIQAQRLDSRAKENAISTSVVQTPQQAAAVVRLDANAPPEKLAIDLLLEASVSPDAIYRAHSLEGLQSRIAVLQPIACRLLADQNPGVRFSAAVMVGKKRITECSHIVEPLRFDPDPSVRAAALYALVRLGHAVDLNPLNELVSSSNPEIRSNTFFVLGELKNPSAIPLVESVVGRRLVGADQTRMRIVDLQAAEALAKMGDYRQYDPIRAALFAPSEQSEIVALACQMVGETNDRGARGHLIGLWNCRGPLERPIEIRLIAGAALARIGEPNLEPILQLCQVAVKDSAPTIRAQAAATLGWVGGQRSLDTLAPLLRDPYALVRLSAASAYLRASADSSPAEVSSIFDANVR